MVFLEQCVSSLSSSLNDEKKAFKNVVNTSFKESNKLL